LILHSNHQSAYYKKLKVFKTTCVCIKSSLRVLNFFSLSGILKIDKKKRDSAVSLSFGSKDMLCAAEMEKEKETKTLRVQNVWQRCPRGYTPQL